MSLPLAAQQRMIASAEAQYGISWQDRSIPEFGFQAILGYSLTGHLSISGGAGGVTAYEYATTSVPLFMRMQYDFRLKKVLPVVGFDLGYSFIIPLTRVTLSDVKINSEALDYKWYELGYGTRSEYLDKSGDIYGIYRFSNGSRSYIDAKKAVYGRDGLFALLNASLAIPLPSIQHNIVLMVSGGMAQYWYGHFVKDTENKILRYGRRDYLAGKQGPLLAKDYTWTDSEGNVFTERSHVQTKGDEVLISGKDPFFRRFRPVLLARLSFEF